MAEAAGACRQDPGGGEQGREPAGAARCAGFLPQTPHPCLWAEHTVALVMLH